MIKVVIDIRIFSLLMVNLIVMWLNYTIKLRILEERAGHKKPASMLVDGTSRVFLCLVSMAWPSIQQPTSLSAAGSHVARFHPAQTRSPFATRSATPKRLVKQHSMRLNLTK